MKEIITRLMCKFLGTHKLEPYKEEDILDVRNNKVGVCIVSKCSICGKIITKNVYTENNRI